ncbi:PAS domain-containing protein [Candidatus Nitrospira bockiana]
MSDVHRRTCFTIDALAAFVDQLTATIAEQRSPEVLIELQNALEELKIAEETLQEQNAALGEALERAEAEKRRYLELFEFAPDAYCVTDAFGVVTEANRPFCELLQCDPARVIGKPLAVFAPREARQGLRSFISKITQQPPETSTSGYPLVWHTEFTVRQDQQIPVSARCSVSRGKDDKVVAIRWLLQDISDRKQAEQAARQLQRTLEKMVDERTRALQEKVEELETFHDVAVGRELRLIELEKEVQRRAANELNGGKAG